VARVLELLAIALVALFLFVSLGGEYPVETPVRTYIVENGVEDIGAVNLVTSVYLGYRAFDTLGETVVLLLAVSGVVFLGGRER